jgi:hypothetical protein
LQRHPQLNKAVKSSVEKPILNVLQGGFYQAADPLAAMSAHGLRVTSAMRQYWPEWDQSRLKIARFVRISAEGAQLSGAILLVEQDVMSALALAEWSLRDRPGLRR